jgi:hypothetical protein
VQVARSIVPEQFKDLNEWTKAGATAEDIYAAFFRNELVEKPEIAEPFLKPKWMAQTETSQTKQQSVFRFIVFRRSLKQWRKKFARPSACRKASPDVAHLEF